MSHALWRILLPSGLYGARSGTPEGDRLDVLATLIDGHESEHHPTDPPDPIEAIKFRMEQQRLTRKDLEGILGSRTGLPKCSIAAEACRST